MNNKLQVEPLQGAASGARNTIMTTANAMSADFGFVVCNAEMHDTVATASHSYASVSRVANGLERFRLAWNLRNFSNQLASFLDGIYTALKQTEATAPKAKADGEDITREDVEQAQRTLEYLYSITNRLYVSAVRKHLTNDSLMAASLRCIQKRSEELLDLADWLQFGLEVKPSELETIFSEARAELADGETFSLSDVR